MPVNIGHGTGEKCQAPLPVALLKMLISAKLTAVIAVVNATKLGQDNFQSLGVCRVCREVGGNQNPIRTNAMQKARGTISLLATLRQPFLTGTF